MLRIWEFFEETGSRVSRLVEFCFGISEQPDVLPSTTPEFMNLSVQTGLGFRFKVIGFRE